MKKILQLQDGKYLNKRKEKKKIKTASIWILVLIQHQLQKKSARKPAQRLLRIQGILFWILKFWICSKFQLLYLKFSNNYKATETVLCFQITNSTTNQFHSHARLVFDKICQLFAPQGRTNLHQSQKAAFDSLN